LTLWPVHAEVLPWAISIDFGAHSSSRFPLERGQTDKQTRLNALPHAVGYTAGVCNE